MKHYNVIIVGAGPAGIFTALELACRGKALKILLLEKGYSNRKTENTNFAILVSTQFTEPFDEPIYYGRYIARLANLLGQGVILRDA